MISICELSPRDGIQVFRNFIPTDLKKELIDSISSSGIREVHVTYFAHPKVIPQVSDAEKVASMIERRPGVTYVGFVPNEVGLRRALYSKMDRISFFISAEETENVKFFGRPRERMLDEFAAISREAKNTGKDVEAFVVRAMEEENTENALRIAETLVKAGVTILYFSNFGIPVSPDRIENFFKGVMNRFSADVGLHLYEEEEKIRDIIEAALSVGVNRFSTSAGGLGPREIAGRHVILPPTELVLEVARVNHVNLSNTLRIVEKIRDIVEPVGHL